MVLGNSANPEAALVTPLTNFWPELIKYSSEANALDEIKNREVIRNILNIF